MKLVQIWGWKYPNSANAKQDNRWQNKERANDHKHDAHCFKPLNGAVPKLNKCVHGRKYVTQAVTTQAICLRSATFNPLVSGWTTK